MEVNLWFLGTKLQFIFGCSFLCKKNLPRSYNNFIIFGRYLQNT